MVLAMKSIVTMIVCGLIVLWAYVYLSTSGVLVLSRGPYTDPPVNNQAIDCTYFHGTGFVTITHWYSENGIVGKTICPRLISLK